jgi:glycosyltransferase A (GT-A) superfamily protein (DUF2064 family)
VNATEVHARVLVMAKAPVPGWAKTRLARDVGERVAAELAAACLLDTLRACAATVGPARCHLALAGDLDSGVRAADVRRALAGWTVHGQRGPNLASRLAHAHLALPSDRPVVQVGMDTPQLRPEHLTEAARAAEDGDAALGPAADGGWWVLALRDPGRARVLAGVVMSTPRTCRDTQRVLEADGLVVRRVAELRDVDTLGDARTVAAASPRTEFARAWSSR